MREVPSMPGNGVISILPSVTCILSLGLCLGDPLT